ncbi:hypothetical protein H5410_015102, partial [Solanum commersonii]
MRCYIFEATEFHNNIYRSDMSYLGYEQANLSYENQQKGIQAPQKHKTKETRFAILMSFELRDHENETREQEERRVLTKILTVEYRVRYLPELIHPNRLGIEKHEGAEKSGTNLYKPTVM